MVTMTTTAILRNQCCLFALVLRHRQLCRHLLCTAASIAASIITASISMLTSAVLGFYLPPPARIVPPFLSVCFHKQLLPHLLPRIVAATIGTTIGTTRSSSTISGVASLSCSSCCSSAATLPFQAAATTAPPARQAKLPVFLLPRSLPRLLQLRLRRKKVPVQPVGSLPFEAVGRRRR